MKKWFLLFVTLLVCFVCNAQQSVDLGLSVDWADRNVGAEQIYDSGGFYDWVIPDSVNTETNDATLPQNICGTEQDIAKINMGDGWRMPTSDELKELVEKCKWEVMEFNNVEGVRVTGPSGNSIFIPMCGAYDRGKFVDDEGTGLWSGTLNVKYARIDFLLLMLRHNTYDDFDAKPSLRLNVRQATLRYKFNVRAVKAASK